MLSYFSKKMNQKGFTLIELIVVIAIIGILIAIAVPRLSGFTGSATTAANDATERTLDGAYAVYLAQEGTDEQGVWPTDYVQDASGDEGTVTVGAFSYNRNTSDDSWDVVE